MPEHSVEPQFQSWEDAVRWLRDQPDRQDFVRAAYYDDPLTAAAERYWSGNEWSAVRELLGPGSGRTALDLGAGRGIASYALARDGFVVTSLEPDPSPLVGAAAIRSLAADADLPITVVQEVSEALPFPDGSFDIVFARAVLHHVDSLETALRELRRVLKPGGRLLAIREHVISRAEHLDAFLDAHPLHNLYGGENAYLLQGYRAALSAAGFTIETELTPLGSPINYAPYSLAELKDEVADRTAALRLPKSLVRPALDMPGAWPLARALLSLVDHRPGRLYSFLCRAR